MMPGRFHLNRTISIALCVGGVLLSFLAPTLTASAAPKKQSVFVNIQSQTVSCNQITVTFAVDGPTSAVPATVTANNTSGTLASVTISVASGTYTATVPISPAQPANTPLYSAVSVSGVSAQGVSTACSGTSTTSPGGSTSGGSGGAPSSWPGYSDGRLNPAMDEYYSVWCGNDLVNVYRSNPRSELLQQVAISKILFMENGSFKTGVGATEITVTRSGDLITLSGNNGNRAPDPGSKSFSLNDCVGHNGEEPSPPAVKITASNDCADAPNSGIKDETPECDFAQVVTLMAGICLPNQAIASGIVILPPALFFRLRRRHYRKP